MAIGNMHKEFGKGHLCGSRYILADCESDTHRCTRHNTL